MSESSPDYYATMQRMKLILESDDGLKKYVTDFRVGELPETTAANMYPAVYVAGAPRPQASRTNVGPRPDINTMPNQLVSFEFNIVLVTRSYTPFKTQEKMYEIMHQIIRILRSNVQLKSPKLNAAGNPTTELNNDPICDGLDIDQPMERITGQRGQLVDGLVLVVRTGDADFILNNTEP